MVGHLASASKRWVVERVRLPGRRHQLRSGVSIPAVLDRTGQRMSATIVELSPGGVLVETGEPPQASAGYTLRFSIVGAESVADLDIVRWGSARGWVSLGLSPPPGTPRASDASPTMAWYQRGGARRLRRPGRCLRTDGIVRGPSDRDIESLIEKAGPGCPRARSAAPAHWSACRRPSRHQQPGMPRERRAPSTPKDKADMASRLTEREVKQGPWVESTTLLPLAVNWFIFNLVSVGMLLAESYRDSEPGDPIGCWHPSSSRLALSLPRVAAKAWERDGRCQPGEQ